MGPTAKAGLICAMVALMLAGQLLEKEFASKRKAAVLEKKSAPEPYAALFKPFEDGDLPKPRPGDAPGPALSVSGGLAGSSAGGLVVAPSAPGESTYVVQQGDTISKIAKRLFGSEGAVDAIVERNKKTLPDPAKLQVGMTLRIPSREKPAPR